MATKNPEATRAVKTVDLNGATSSNKAGTTRAVKADLETKTVKADSETRAAKTVDLNGATRANKAGTTRAKMEASVISHSLAKEAKIVFTETNGALKVAKLAADKMAKPTAQHKVKTA